MEKKILFLIFLAWNISTNAFAQSDSISLPKNNDAKQFLFILKLTPFSMLETDPNIQLGVEYKLNDKWSLQHDLGYGNFDFGDIGIPLQVFKFRTEARLYLNPTDKPTGKYIAPYFLYKNTSQYDPQTVGLDCLNGDCAYFKTVDSYTKRNAFALGVKYGKQKIYKSGFVIELYVGAGFRMISAHYTAEALGEVQREPNRNIWGALILPHRNSIGFYRYPDLSLGVKVGWAFFKNKNKF